MTIPPKAADTGIFVDPPLNWGFSCAYTTSYDISNDMTVAAANIQNDFTGSGSFDLSLRKVLDIFTKLDYSMTQIFWIFLPEKCPKPH